MEIVRNTALQKSSRGYHPAAFVIAMLCNASALSGIGMCHVRSVMEQADSGKCHNHLVCVARVNHSLIAYGAARLCDIFDAASVGTFDIVAEWEERV